MWTGNPKVKKCHVRKVWIIVLIDPETILPRYENKKYLFLIF